MTYDEEIEPDNLIPEYLKAQKDLLEYERSGRKKSTRESENSQDSETEFAIAKLKAKLEKIQNDVLFDKFLAEQQWKTQRIALEKEIAVAKKQAKNLEKSESELGSNPENPDPLDDVNEEAERIAAEILKETNEGEDDYLGDLFGSLPQHEVDPTTGKTNTVITSADGAKIVIKDFGKWTGISPRRVLEEACRSRYVGYRQSNRFHARKLTIAGTLPSKSSTRSSPRPHSQTATPLILPGQRLKTHLSIS